MFELFRKEPLGEGQLQPWAGEFTPCNKTEGFWENLEVCFDTLSRHHHSLSQV